MLLLLLFLGLQPEPTSVEEPGKLLEQARAAHDQIEQANRDSRETRSMYRGLLETCVQLRRAAPSSVPLYINEGHAASLAGDWPHALLAYRLAQRLAPNDVAVASRLTAVRGRLLLPDEPVSGREQVFGAMSANSNLRASFWLLALVLYVAAWVRIAGLAPFGLGSGIWLSLLGIGAATAIVVGLVWVDDYRLHTANQKLAVIRRGDPVSLREGNGLSYPVADADRLRTGTELCVLGKRGDWLHVRIASARVGWIPAGTAEVE